MCGNPVTGFTWYRRLVVEQAHCLQRPHNNWRSNSSMAMLSAPAAAERKDASWAPRTSSRGGNCSIQEGMVSG